MPNWYATRERCKAAAGIEGSGSDVALDLLIEAHSRAIDRTTHTRFLPVTETRKLEYNGRWVRGGHKVFFDADLVSVTTLKDRGGARTLTEDTDFILMPENEGPPYSWAEILRSQGSVFEAGASTAQQSFEIAGLWAAHSETQAASSIAENTPADGTSTSLHVKNGSKVGVGDTLLIGTEQVFVSERGDVDLAVNTHGTTGALGADDTDTTVTLVSAPTDAVNVGEVLRIGSEAMKVTAINTTSSFEVERAHDGTALAAHSTGDDVFIRRTYTIQRGVNGTTAATHADDKAISRYRPPSLIEELTVAEVVREYHMQRSGYSQRIGSGDTQVFVSADLVKDLRARAVSAHRRHLIESL